jgi:hypothetical protein
MHSLFNQGALDEETTRTIQAARGEAIKQEMLAQTGLGLAGIAKVGGMAEAIAVSMGNELAFRNKFTPEAEAAAKKDAEAQKNTVDKQTQKMTDAILATQEAMMKTQKAVLDTGIMTGYSASVAGATTAMLDMIKAFRKEISKITDKKEDVDTAPTTTSRRRRTLERLGEGLDSNAPNPPQPPQPPQVQPPPAPPTQPQEDNRSFLQKALGMSARGRNAPLSEEIAKFAKGGIIEGPSTGTLAMLHGKEIVMPLPTNFDISDLLKQADNQIAATGSIIDPQLAQMMAMFGDDMKTSTNTQKISLDTDQQIATLMRSLNTKFDDMIDQMREVVANTDRTARGVA